MSKAQLMLEDSLDDGQVLGLIGHSVESVRQGMQEMSLIHAHWRRGMEVEGRGGGKEGTMEKRLTTHANQFGVPRATLT